jgi:amino acid adenylation domain-containing protein
MEITKSIVRFFNEFREARGAIWSDQKSIKLSVPTRFQNNQTKDFINCNLQQILAILDVNSIKSADDFFQKVILKINGVSRYPLSASQERLWFIEQYERGTNAYHIPEIFELDDAVNFVALREAIHTIVRRHDVLGSVIVADEETSEPYQTLCDTSFQIEEITIPYDDLRETLSKEINRPFDLTRERPIRAVIFRKSIEDSLHVKGKSLLLLNIHHIATDGWSGGILLRELMHLYEYYDGKKSNSLPELEIQYKDYAFFQKSWLDWLMEREVAFWKQKLSGFETLLLPTDFSRPQELDYKGNHVKFELTRELSDRLRALCRRGGATIHSTMLAAFNILLGKYSGQHDIIIGVPIANRHYRQTEELIGFFVNMQINRVTLNESENFCQLIQRVQADQVAAQEHQDLPFEKLLHELQIERDSSRHPIFQVLFQVHSVLQQAPVDSNARSLFKPLDIDDQYQVERFDLSVNLYDCDAGLIGHLSYSTSLFRRETIVEMIDRYKYVLEMVTDSPWLPYSKIGLLRGAQYEQVVREWNETDEEFTQDVTAAELFVRQVQRTPDHVALRFEQFSLTYEELNWKANQLARHLRKEFLFRRGRELRSGDPIALVLDRSIEMVLAIWGVLKAGGAYVPIDPSYPQDRIDFILSDTDCALIMVGTQTNAHRLPKDRVLRIALTESFYESEKRDELPEYTSPGEVAYIIYTSGTTGKPKGVMIPHSGLINRIEWMQRMYPLSTSDVVLQKTPYVFDVSVWEFLWPSWYGSTLVVARPDGHKDSEYLYKVIEAEQVTTLHFVPSMLAAYNDFLLTRGYGVNASLRQVFCSGEALPRTVVDQFLNNASNGVKLHNLYGPTEASIDVTYFETIPGQPVYIGKPIQNTRVYILDTSGNPVPVGIQGELYLGGAGLATGYLNRADLTGERFIDNAFATATDKSKGYTKLYKTGDLVRWTGDGNIEYLGRNDDQVKIHGHRIELGEIENALASIKGIKQCCVLMRESTNAGSVARHLVGYYSVDSSNFSLSETEVQEILAMSLPSYMIPGILILVEFFQVTSNGKLDKKLLPEPCFETRKAQHIEPQTASEKKMCALWEKVLGVEQIGIEDDFFRLGGSSILAVKVASQMSKILDSRFDVADIFRFKTIRRMLQHRTVGRDLAKPFHGHYIQSLPDLVFLPPGGGGPEKYQPLADRLAAKFNCIGLENYNIVHDEKLYSLSDIAAEYLSAIENDGFMKSPINLVGWSLGGLIALQVAAILEQRGYKRISVYLLDTLIKDDNVQQMLGQIDFDVAVSNQQKKMLTKYDSQYVNRVFSAFEVEKSIASCPVTYPLHHAEVVLFKATERGNDHANSDDERRLDTYIKNLSDNNIGSVAKNLTVIPLKCNHFNMIETHEEYFSNFLIQSARVTCQKELNV